MTLNIIVDESVANELVSRCVSQDLLNELRQAPSFSSVTEALAFIGSLDTRYYDRKEFPHQGVTLSQRLGDGDVGIVDNNLAYVVKPVLALPFRLTITQGGITYFEREIDRLPIYVAAFPFDSSKKPAAYLVLNGGTQRV